MRVLIIAPDEFTAQSIQRQFADSGVVARPWFNLTGHRGDLVLVMTPRVEMSGAEREAFERAKREHFPTKVALGGRMFTITEEN